MTVVLQAIFFIPLAYALVFLLYTINKPQALTIKEPAINIAHVLNQEMLREVDYRYLVEMARQGISPSRGALTDFADYFQLVVDHVPDQADAYGMLGYCRYYLGDEDAAIKNLKEALQVNPSFLGFYYNLAAIYYNKGDYLKAVSLAQRALELPIQLSAGYILSSNRVYMPVLQQMPGSNIVDYLPGGATENNRIAEIFYRSFERSIRIFKSKKSSPSNYLTEGDRLI